MDKSIAVDTTESGKLTVFKAALLSLPMILLTGLMTTQGRLPTAAPALIAWILTFAFLNILFFLMVYTGSWRSPGFRSPPGTQEEK